MFRALSILHVLITHPFLGHERAVPASFEDPHLGTNGHSGREDDENSARLQQDFYVLGDSREYILWGLYRDCIPLSPTNPKP